MHFEYSSLVADYDLRGFKINVTMAEKSAPKPQSSYSHGYNSWSCTYCCYHCYDEKLFLLNINRLLNIIVIPLEKKLGAYFTKGLEIPVLPLSNFNRWSYFTEAHNFSCSQRYKR